MVPGKVFEYRASDKVDLAKVNKNEVLRNDVCEVFKKHKIDRFFIDPRGSSRGIDERGS